MDGKKIVANLEERVNHYRQTRACIALTPEMHEAAEKEIKSRMFGSKKLFYGKGESAIFYNWFERKCYKHNDTEPSPEEIFDILNIPIKKDIADLELPSRESVHLMTYAADYAVTRESGGPVMRGAKFGDMWANPLAVLLVGCLTIPINPYVGAGATLAVLIGPPMITQYQMRRRCLEGYRENPNDTLLRQTPPAMRLWRKEIIQEINAL